MRKNLLLTRRNPFFLHACLFWGIGIIQQTKPLKHVVVTDGDELTLLGFLT
ncbi:hypothetical protein QF042_001290 [Pedobacter sp. W3I1]|uniref:hypothetical protein n=1 Tax=Pedobacter sp. W3I1 TaxID=3042291 RepID=UPI00278583C6|nr:hypothetical protein [Pedobacter sp. W3I1]MDQ0637725.1 hypothetical protein [Pedobacter sp. W3I1]